MKVIFDELASLELNDTVEFYELKVAGLGKRFKDEIKIGIRRIRKHPYSWSKQNDEVRRYFLHKFPYKILYSIEKNYIYIIAIANCHRRPDYWINRI
ncbi:MAG: type II toxin-antitoxin system RelE/ParE family toxin [Bacteroidota bacterium]|nr:type II toxin-antitoxin system RelE/ParE family toxin [Bacteroidota bacterium]